MSLMRTTDFDYRLPSRRIAQHPLPERDRSRLLIVEREKRRLEPARFKDLASRLEPGDLIVVNDVRVAPLRLAGNKATGGRAEITLTKRLGSGDLWECLIKARKPEPGMDIILPGGLRARVLGKSESTVRVSPGQGAPLWRVKIPGEGLEKTLERHGLIPLPPYIRRKHGDDPAPDRERYQTVYANHGEAAAAPTAGLHFTPRLIEELGDRGVEIARIRLDVSYGTFAPVRVENIDDHRMHPERFEVPAAAAEAVEKARSRGGRVVAVGTTAVRALEHLAREDATIKPGRGETSLFIRPGFRFRVVDAMVTNFHMPKSTLIMLVSAFAGRELILEAYKYALDRGFRFLSYGDAMLIL
jgi:S-adenosylmethionine:tRNA ribosyltransferase-isomerase